MKSLNLEVSTSRNCVERLQSTPPCSSLSKIQGYPPMLCPSSRMKASSTRISGLGLG